MLEQRIKGETEGVPKRISNWDIKTLEVGFNTA